MGMVFKVFQTTSSVKIFDPNGLLYTNSQITGHIAILNLWYCFSIAREHVREKYNK